jgi:hypothetical protein
LSKEKAIDEKIELGDQYREADGQRHLENLFVGYFEF